MSEEQIEYAEQLTTAVGFFVIFITFTFLAILIGG